MVGRAVHWAMSRKPLFVVLVLSALQFGVYLCQLKSEELSSFAIIERQSKKQEEAITCLLGTLIATPDSEDGKEDAVASPEEHFTCEFELDDAISSSIRRIRGLSDVKAKESREAMATNAGEVYLTASKADFVDQEILIPPGASVRLETNNWRHRRLSKATTGDRYLMVLRVSGSNGTEQVSLSSVEIAEHVYGGDVTGDGVVDEINLVSQMAKCSDNALRLQAKPSDGIGVRELTISEKVDNAEMFDVVLWVDRKAAEEELHLRDYDYVLYVLPPGTKMGGKWYSAYAWLWGHRSVYGDMKLDDGSVSNWIASVSSLMHEVGHNLGLKHSGEGRKEYGDKTGYMGPMQKQTDGPLKCFNAHKSSQLGWYAKREKIVDPHVDSFAGKLIGVADYASSSDEHTMILKVLRPHTGGDDLYLTYNTKKGINIGTGEFDWTVPLVEGMYGEDSWFRGMLEWEGDKLSFDNFDESGFPLIASVHSFGTDTDGKVHYAYVTVELDRTYDASQPVVVMGDTEKPFDLGPNLAFDADVTASSSLGEEYKPENALDGLTTEWAADGDGTDAWLKVAFKEIHRVKYIGYKSRPFPDVVSSFVVTFSDGSTQKCEMNVNKREEFQFFDVEDKFTDSIELKVDSIYGESLDPGAVEIAAFTSVP